MFWGFRALLLSLAHLPLIIVAPYLVREWPLPAVT
jgi:hypothetical protein